MVMRIFCLIDNLDSGGAQRQLIGLAGQLKEKNYQVKIFSYWGENFWDKYLIDRKIEFENISGANIKLRKFLTVYMSFKKYKPDVVIAYLDSPAIIACFIKLISGKQFKLIVSDRNTTQKFSLAERIKFFMFKWADTIVPNSISQERFIKKNYPGLESKIRTITNFVDTESFYPSPDKSKDNDGIRIIVAGRVAPQKNVLLFLRSVKKIIDLGYNIQVYWIGRPNPIQYYEECVSLKEDLNINNNFFFLEHTSDVLVEYQKSDVFCLSSIYEGFPNVICEAMSCGLPILCSNICDNPYIVRDQINGFLFDPYSIDEMTNTIIKFIELSNEDKIEMGIQSRNIALNNFSKESFLKSYLQIIDVI